jgi:hypothetical protein
MICSWATVCSILGVLLYSRGWKLDSGILWCTTSSSVHSHVSQNFLNSPSKVTLDLTAMANYSKFIWPLLSSVAFTTTAIHMVDQRKTMESERLKMSTQVSVLENLVGRLRAGEFVTDEDIHKIKRRVGLIGSPQHNAAEHSWKDALFKAVKPSAQSVHAEEEQLQKGEDIVEGVRWFCSVTSSDAGLIRI